MDRKANGRSSATSRSHVWRNRLASTLFWAATALCLALIVGVVHVGRRWDQEEQDAKARSDAARAEARAFRLKVAAQEFIERVERDGRQHRTVLFRIEDGVELPVSLKDSRTFTFPAKTADGKECSLTVEAYGDISAEAIWMRPRVLKCPDGERAVRGEIREPSGRILDAQVVVDDSAWLSLPKFSLRLPPYTVAQAWME